MVISCLTIYAIAFSCFTMLIGKTFAVTPVYVDVDPHQNDKRGNNKIHIQNQVRTTPSVGSKTNDKLFPSAGDAKILQSFYQPSNTVKVKRLSNHSISELNQLNHSYFALFDTKNNETKKFSLSDKYYPLMSLSDVNNNYELESKRKAKHQKNRHGNGGTKKRKIRNFIVWDTLRDSEKEIRVHYNGITAKETAVRTGRNEETGKSEGLKLRQLTDGIHFIQLIYNYDNQIQDCEYVKLKPVIQKFLNTFRSDVEKAKINYEKQEDEADEGEDEENKIDVETSPKEEDDDEDYLEEDEGKIEQYLLDEEEYEGENLDSEYRNVTFQIIADGEKLPGELAAWMNYPVLKRRCRENQKIFRSLAYDREHGDEEARKLAEEHIERKKRDVSIIFPGTNWCGKSNTAEKYTHLGGFFRTDKCCRAHDHCRPQIQAFQMKYEHFNFRPFTVSHCKCDRRRKRDIADVLLVPGTKWCGKGRRATKYTSLGGFSRTDKCCRVHDTMCPHWIGGLQKKYGFFNWRINTIMHCRCDKRFRACLKMAKTGTANFVGKLFFNVVQTKCFVLKPKEVCLKYSRWGKCEKKEFRKQAHLKDNLQY